MNNKYGNRTKEGTAPVILDSETEFAAPCCKLEQHKLPLCEVLADIIVVQSTGACTHCAGFSQISRTVSVRMHMLCVFNAAQRGMYTFLGAVVRVNLGAFR